MCLKEFLKKQKINVDKSMNKSKLKFCKKCFTQILDQELNLI